MKTKGIFISIYLSYCSSLVHAILTYQCDDSLEEEQPVHYRVHPESLLQAQPIEVIASISLVECLLTCSKNCNCVSVNVVPTGNSGGLVNCSLIDHNLAENRDGLSYLQTGKYLVKMHESTCSGCRSGLTKSTMRQFCNCTKHRPIAVDCKAQYDANPHIPNAIFRIQPFSSFPVLTMMCNMHRMDIQSRSDGSVDFNRSWIEYKEGFGHLTTEYWIGNDIIHHVTTKNGPQILTIRMDYGGHGAFYARYNIRVDDEKELYRLHIKLGITKGGDSLSPHDGHTFKTYDSTDNECSLKHSSGWWFHNTDCMTTNLNGPYNQEGFHGSGQCVSWPAFRKNVCPVRVKMRLETRNY